MADYWCARMRGCVGVDATDTSLADTNAQRNGLTNCSFLTGNLEDVMPSLAEELTARCSSS